MLPLHGVAVLVTRPEQQAESLCALLEARGASVLRLPVIRIEPTNLVSLRSRVDPIEAFDIVIFTSANAVRFGLTLLGSHRELTVAAVGPATARALQGAGLRVTIFPKDGFDSEHLLLHPMLLQPEGRRILIVKGIGGRELLERELDRRGAHVTLAEVYERRRVEYASGTLQALESHFHPGEVRVITATSAEIAEGLVALANPALRREFDRSLWVVPSGRVADTLRELSVRAPTLIAASAEDQDLVSAIEGWRAGVSTA